MSTGLVSLGKTLLGLAPTGFALANVVECVLSLGRGVILLKKHRKLAAQQAAAPATVGQDRRVLRLRNPAVAVWSTSDSEATVRHDVMCRMLAINVGRSHENRNSFRLLR